jgi:glycopeptide antibiotics resistance protein
MAKQKRIWAVLFALYCAAMACLLFGRKEAPAGIPYDEQILMRLNLIPFRTLRLFADLLNSGVRSHITIAVINLGGNIIMFIPLGFLLPKVFPKRSSLPRVLITTALIITLVEIIQLFTLVGSCDIDDLILNVVGSAMGYWFHKLI